jgi:hypothetical protein
MTEYLNAYCAHCRATHGRLDKVLAGSSLHVERHRVYVWPGKRPPYWVWACICAGAQGKEEAFLAELLQTSGDDERSIRAAAQRVLIDLDELDRCMREPSTRERLEQNKRARQAARIEELPTIDIGRWRLMGEQTEAEILDTLNAAAQERP